MESVIEENLRKMTGNVEGDMLPLLFTESIGGNAGKCKGYPCVAANFYMDSSSGEIKYFGNPQNTPRKIVQQFKECNFRLMYDVNRSWKYRIIESSLEKATRTARLNLKKTISAYNKKYAFRP